jgi:hypothetical protein
LPQWLPAGKVLGSVSALVMVMEAAELRSPLQLVLLLLSQ